MRTRLCAAIPLVLAAVLLAAVAAGGAAAQDVAGVVRPSVVRLTTVLTGAEEAPGPGDPDGGGRATLVLLPERGRLCYALVARDIAPATAAHVHVGPPGEAGPVVVTLEPPTRGAAGGCVAADPALLAAIAADPGAYYVNVHNAEYPAGAIRGQLG